MPWDLCGYAITDLKACYSNVMRIPGVGLVRGRYYRTSKPYLGLPTVFDAWRWDRDDLSDADWDDGKPGDIRTVPWLFYNGNPPVPCSCTAPRGRPEAFMGIDTGERFLVECAFPCAEGSGGVVVRGSGHPAQGRGVVVGGDFPYLVVGNGIAVQGQGFPALGEGVTVEGASLASSGTVAGEGVTVEGASLASSGTVAGEGVTVEGQGFAALGQGVELVGLSDYLSGSPFGDGPRIEGSALTTPFALGDAGVAVAGDALELEAVLRGGGVAVAGDALELEAVLRGGGVAVEAPLVPQAVGLGAGGIEVAAPMVPRAFGLGAGGVALVGQGLVLGVQLRGQGVEADGGGLAEDVQLRGQGVEADGGGLAEDVQLRGQGVEADGGFDVGTFCPIPGSNYASAGAFTLGQTCTYTSTDGINGDWFSFPVTNGTEYHVRVGNVTSGTVISVAAGTSNAPFPPSLIFFLGTGCASATASADGTWYALVKYTQTPSTTYDIEIDTGPC